MVKRSSDPLVTHHEVKVQERELVRFVCIVAPLAPRGFSIRENFVLSRHRGYMGTGDLCECPQQRYTTGEPGKVQGWDRVGIVEGSCAYWARQVSIRKKFVLSRNTGYKKSGVAIWLNGVLTPRVAHPEVKVHPLMS